jgi:Lon-like ATP-dependent protease
VSRLLKEAEKDMEKKSKEPEPIPPRPASGRGSSAGGGSGGADGGDGGGKKRKGSDRSLVKSSIPEVYPQVMAIPLVRRPLFPGFYKAITIRDRAVGEAIADMVKRGQPYIGAFMFKDDTADKDVIDDISEVHDVGTFCQVTTAFPVGGEDNFAMTCVLYPHRRIKMTGLKPPKADPEPAEEAPSVVESALEEVTVNESPSNQAKGDVVASFEEASDEAKALEDRAAERPQGQRCRSRKSR